MRAVNAPPSSRCDVTFLASATTQTPDSSRGRSRVGNPYPRHRWRPTGGAQMKIMEVDALPAHGGLDHAVQFAERERRGHKNAPPHHGADPGQPDFDLEDGLGLRRGLLRRHGRLRPSFHPARLQPLSLAVAGHPRDPHALRGATIGRRRASERGIQPGSDRAEGLPRVADYPLDSTHGRTVVHSPGFGLHSRLWAWTPLPRLVVIPWTALTQTNSTYK